MEGWQKQASALFFDEHLGIGVIAGIVRRTRETVSRYIHDCEGYDAEIAFRKAQSQERRKAQQTDWDRNNRPERYRCVSGDTMRQEHELAVRILSRERHCHE